MAIALRALGTTSKVASGNLSPGLPAGHTTDDLLVLVTNQQDNVACSVIPNSNGAAVRSVGAKSATAVGGGTGPLTISAPSGIATGDLEILMGSTIAGANTSISTAGGGAWTAVDNQDVTAGDKLYVWYRIRAGGDSDPQLSTTSDHIVGCRIAVLGGSFDSSTPVEIINKSSEATSDTSFSYAPGTSTTVDNALCFVVCSSGVDSNTGQAGTNTANANLTSIALLMEHESTSGGGGGYWAATGLLGTAGAVGTWTQTMVTATPKAYISFAVRPYTGDGWTLKDSLNDGTNRRGEIWWKRDNGAESAPTVVHAAGGVSNAVVAAYSGVDNSIDPWRDVQRQTGTSTTTFTAPALTGVVSGDMRIFYGLFTVNDTSGTTTNNWGTVSTFTEERDDCSSLGGAWAVSFGIDDVVATGSAGSITSAVGWTGGTTSWGWICWQLAISSDTGGGTSETPGIGPAAGSGVAPVAKASVTLAGAVGAGLAPAPKASAALQGAVGLGVAPSPAKVAVPQGGATAGGFAPAEPGGGVSETPGRGGAVAAGLGPAAAVPTLAPGGSLGQGAAPVARAAVTLQGALGQGIAPAPRASVTLQGAIASTLSPTPAKVLVALQGATAGGFSPTVPGADFPPPGGAVAGGLAPAVRVSTPVGGAAAAGAGATVRVTVGVGGAVAGGQLADPGGVPPPGSVDITDQFTNTVTVTDQDGAAVSVADSATVTLDVADGTGSGVALDDASGGCCGDCGLGALAEHMTVAKIVHYDIDDYWQPQATFSVNGSPADPGTIIVTAKDADGAITTITTASTPSSLTTASTPLARVGAGVFKLNPGTQLTKAGYWFTRFKSTGAGAAAEEQQAICDPSEFNASGGLSARALVGLAETKDWLQQANVDTSNDLDVVNAINAASELAHDEARREFKRTDTTTASTARLYAVEPLSYSQKFVRIDDLSTSPTLVRILANDQVTVVATVASTEYSVYPQTRESWAPVTGLQFENTVIRPRPGQWVEVTGVWGFPAIPDQLKSAVKDVVADWLDRDVEHYRQDYEPRTSGGGTNVIIVPGTQPAFLAANPKSLSIFRSFRSPHLG